MIQDHAFEFDRFVGQDGVLAFGRHGVVLGVSSADSRALLAKPFPGTAEEHTQVVLDYFAGAGLPKEQIAETRVHSDMEASGGPEDQGTGIEGKARFPGYASVLTRALGDIPVSGSYAWAKFNANYDVVGEEVFWPDLPSSVLEEAKRLKNQLEESSRDAAFAARFPAEVRKLSPRVAIFHSPHFQEEFEVFAGLGFPGAESPQRLSIDGKTLTFGFEKEAARQVAQQAPRVR